MIATSREIEDKYIDDLCWSCYEPHVPVDSFNWICDNMAMPDGVPFNPDGFPWTEGICKAWDNSDVTTVVLQFAARLGKTAIAQSLLVCGIANRPGPTLFGSSTEGLAKQVIKKKLLPMLRATDDTRSWIPEDKDLLSSRLDLKILTIYVAWSGSPTTLSDIDPLYSHANEVDKWTFDQSLEGDRVKLFLERGIERPDRKAILEGTPTIDGNSRINRLLINGWDCRFPVPCHFCGRFQKMIINLTKEPKSGGIWWDRLANGDHPSPDAAAASARYFCCHCQKEIDDEFRRPMIRRGVWVPRGQRVIKSGRIVGTMLNPGPVASFQMSRLYAPTFTFGDIARELVASRGVIEAEQNYDNSWLGETHHPRSKYADWEEVSDRVVMNYSVGEILPDTNFLTAGVDRQIDHMVFVLMAWNRFQFGRTVAYGVVPTWQDLFETYLHVQYKHPIYGLVSSSLTLIDARSEPDDVHATCQTYSQTGRLVWPLQGMRTVHMGGKMYRLESLDDSRTSKRRMKGMQLVKVNTGFTQSWIDNCLYRRRAGDNNSIAFPSSARHDQDLFEQLTNEAQDEKSVWVPVHNHTPVDYRDCVRYARVAAEVFTRGAWGSLMAPARPLAQQKRNVPKPREAQEEGGSSKKWIRDSRKRKRGTSIGRKTTVR